MHSILRLGIALTLVACGRGEAVGPPASPTPSSVAGSYTLTKLDGHALPVTVIDLGAYQVQVVSGTLALNAAGTYGLELGYRVHDSGNIRTATDSDSGLWSVTGDTITVASTEAGLSGTGTISGDVITLRSSVRVLELRK